jgi:hypothetical protein
LRDRLRGGDDLIDRPNHQPPNQVPAEHDEDHHVGDDEQREPERGIAALRDSREHEQARHGEHERGRREDREVAEQLPTERGKRPRCHDLGLDPEPGELSVQGRRIDA